MPNGRTARGVWPYMHPAFRYKLEHVACKICVFCVSLFTRTVVSSFRGRGYTLIVQQPSPAIPSPFPPHYPSKAVENEGKLG